MATMKFYKALGAITSLGDPVRRRLYEAVALSARPVSRNELAKSTGVARPLVAYHLDRLVRDGLLATSYGRQTGRTGPGAGRPAKLYFRPKSPIQVTLPPRNFELAARILLEAFARQPTEEREKALDELARHTGEAMAREHPDVGRVTDYEVLSHLLGEAGYEPQTAENGEVCFRNCIFHELADQKRGLVCAMNHSLVNGMLQALPEAGVEAELRPTADQCCVVLVPDSRPVPGPMNDSGRGLNGNPQ